METPTDVLKQLTAKDLFSNEEIRAKFHTMLGKKAAGFMTSVLQCVASSEMLKKATPVSIYNAAAVAASMDLPLNNQLGFAYIVPYNVSVKNPDPNAPPDHAYTTQVVAQFQIGYKGYIQLAQRSAQYHKLAATEILAGQLVSEDPLQGYVFDFSKKAGPKGEPLPVVGYASYFKLLNGFEKLLYMTNEKLEEHGRRYSKSYEKAGGLWKTDPHAMKMKTVIRLLLSKFGPMSIEMQNAMLVDQALIEDAGTLNVRYVDNKDGVDPEVSKERERVSVMIKDATTVEALEKLYSYADVDQATEIAAKELTILRGQILANNKGATTLNVATEKKITERIKVLEELTK